MRRFLRALLLAACAAALPAETPSAIALHDARIVSVSGPVIERGTVILRDGLIQSVGQDAAIPPDAWVIEAKGLTVYPGLIDSLSSIGLPESSPAAASAASPAGRGRGGSQSSAMPVTKGPEDRPSNNSWLRAADLIDPADRRIEDARAAGFTSAVTFPTTGIFAGQGAFLNLATGKKSRIVVDAPAGQYVNPGRSGYAGEFPASLMGAIAYVRQVYLDAAHYKLEKSAWDRNLAGARRPDYDRPVEGLNESPRSLLPARSAVEIHRMLRFSADLKIPAVLYGGHEAYGAAAELARARVPILVSLKWPERARGADPEEVVPLRTLELWDRAPSSPAALVKAGASFAFYADGTAPRDLAKAVKKAIDAGLAPADAVRALTLNAAAIYGLDRRLGSIDPGKIANLIVTEGDLFQEKTRVKYVFVDGVKYQPAPAPEPPQRGGDQ